jgi:hypothetical protein
MAAGKADRRAEGRREAAPAAFVALGVLVVLGLLSRALEWELLGLPWWIWLVVCIPALLLTIDLSLTLRGGKGLVRSRRAALLLLGLLVVGNFVAIAILVAGLVTQSTTDLSGGELLLTAFAIYTADVIVFGLMFLGARWRRADRTERGFDPHEPRLRLPPGRQRRRRAGGLAPTGLGLPVRIADQLDCVQPDGRNAPFVAREGDDGAGVGDLGGDRAARRRPSRERARVLGLSHMADELEHLGEVRVREADHGVRAAVVDRQPVRLRREARRTGRRFGDVADLLVVRVGCKEVVASPRDDPPRLVEFAERSAATSAQDRKPLRGFRWRENPWKASASRPLRGRFLAHALPTAPGTRSRAG